MDDEFENPTFEPDEPDNEPDVDDLYPFAGGATALPAVGQDTTASSSQGQRLLQNAVDDYYGKLESERGLTPTSGRDSSKFVLIEGRLWLKKFPGVDIIDARTGGPLALGTIANRRNGSQVVRELGFIWSRQRQRLPARTEKALQADNKKLDEASAHIPPAEQIELKDFEAAAQGGAEASEVLESAFTDKEIDEVLGPVDDPPLDLRELRGLNKALQSHRGELTNNLAKLTELDKHIALERRKLEQAEDEFSRRRIAERVRNLEDERASRLEAAKANREALRGQVERIRETFRRILNEDTTLAERVRTLFREQGITIFSVLTAIGMAISTLVLALTGGGSVPVPTPAPAPPKPSDGGLKDWVKKHLQALGRLLAKLAGKAAAALPGVIGSIVSWLLGTLGKTATWLAENLWAMVAAAGALLFVAAREWLTPPRERPKRR